MTEKHQKPFPSNQALHFARNIILKAMALFVVVNLFFSFASPLQCLGRISLYNHLFPGRQRLPYSDFPERAYNLSLYNLEAMFASHEISESLSHIQEYRVVLIGDSSTWGFLLPVEHTLSAFLRSSLPAMIDGRKVRVYNLGYPVMSLTKDLLILSYAMSYKPDLIIWLVTLESFPYDKQLFPPLLQNNAESVATLIDAYNLKLDTNDPVLIRPGFWERTLIGSRRSLADLAHLQLNGVMWAATGIDQDIPSFFTPRQEDLADDLSFHNLPPPGLNESDLAFDILLAGVKLAQPVPVLVINEPMFISSGKNSQIRYNFYYPRWAYDSYRELMTTKSAQDGWMYLDFWNAVPETEFTNSAVHLTSLGNQQLASLVARSILDIIQQPPIR